jgi:hypothetical protein
MTQGCVREFFKLYNGKMWNKTDVVYCNSLPRQLNLQRDNGIKSAVCYFLLQF